MVVAAALGGTVLTAVPAALPVAMVTAAHADCDHQTGCDDQEEPEEPEDPDVPITDPGDYDVPPLDPVEIIATPPVEALPPAQPPSPAQSSTTPGVSQVGPPTTEQRQIVCFHNNSSVPQHVTQQVTYTTSWEVSGSLTASALQTLSAELGVQFTTSTQHQQTIDVTIPPGGSFGLFAVYERATYIVTTGNFLTGYTSQSAEVRSPTNTTNSSSRC